METVTPVQQLTGFSPRPPSFQPILTASLPPKESTQHPRTPPHPHPLHRFPESKGRGAPKGAAWMCLRAQQRGAEKRSMVEFTKKYRTHPIPRAIAGSPAVAPAHSHATPPALPCPRARDAQPPKPPWTPHRPAPPPRATFPGPKGSEAPTGAAWMCAAWMCLRAQQGSAKKRSKDLLQSPAKKRRKEKPDSNHRKIPNPSHTAGPPPAPLQWALPTPMPRRRRSHARKSATPRIPQDTPNLPRPAPPPRATFPGPMDREAPKDPAWMCPGAQQRSAERHSRELLQSSTEKRLKAKPGRIPREIPKPLHAVGLAHSPAAPQALPCPRARNAPATKANPDIPPPRTTVTFPGPTGREAPKGAAWKRHEAQQGEHRKAQQG